MRTARSSARKPGERMREQQSGLGYHHAGQGRGATPQRTVPASQHRVGHNAGLHPEDQPFLTGSMTMQPTNGHVFVQDDELEEDESYYITRPHTSARRYNTTTDGYIIRQGNRKFIVHDELPPVRQRRQLPPLQHDRQEEAQPKPHRINVLVWIVAALCVMLIGFIAFSSLGSWVQAKQDDFTYGQIRHFTTDVVVGHADSVSNPSHFIAEN